MICSVLVQAGLMYFKFLILFITENYAAWLSID